MENTYYYFFSAVPQVLGAILALFGVFVLFKLQSLSNVLSQIVSTLYEDLRSPQGPNFQENSDIRLKLAGLCFDAFNYKSYKPVEDYFKTFDNDIFSKYPNYKVYHKRFRKTFQVYLDLRNRTVFATIFTSFTILLCLTLLPFAKFISCNYVLVFLLFTVTIICVLIVFIFLIIILKKSLN